jgi:hypothetical protein
MNESDIKELKTLLQDQRALNALLFTQLTAINASITAFMALHPEGEKLLGLCQIYSDSTLARARDQALSLGLSSTVQSFFSGTLPDLPPDASPEP